MVSVTTQLCPCGMRLGIDSVERNGRGCVPVKLSLQTVGIFDTQAIVLQLLVKVFLNSSGHIGLT